jgi:hypothetical protein
MGSHRRFIYGLIATVALLVGAPAARATAPGENGKIAFASQVGSCCSAFIHTVTPDPNPALRNETNLTPTFFDSLDPAWSPDGTKIAFRGYPTQNDPGRIWVMNEDGSGKTQVSQLADPAYVDAGPTWSPDGKIAWSRFRPDCSCGGEVWVANADGTNAHILFTGPGFGDWSPDGSKFAGSSCGELSCGISVVNADGTNYKSLRGGSNPSWSPSGNWIAYSDTNGRIQRVTPDGSYDGPTQDYPATDPDWSPDGRFIVDVHPLALPFPQPPDLQIFVREEGVEAPGGVAASGYVVADNGSQPDWQPLPPFVKPPGYPRPRGAGPIDVSLVPAYSSCDSPNSTHGAALSFGSCAPPTQTSSTLTAGTPDANGQGARFVGRARLTPIPGDPSTPQDEADLRVRITVTDVRCQTGGFPGCDAPLSDYSGALRGTFDLQITDHDNGGSGVESATTETIPYWHPALPITVPCTPTADTSVGSTCAVDTTADAIAGDVTPEGERSTWAIGQVELWDSGPDGNLGTDDNTLFAVQGVFVP